MSKPRIYLDHAATSPLRPEARAAMEEGFAIWANPSSPHAEGRKAKQALEDARERIKRALGWDGELIFTSGASEALWIALNRAKVDRRIVSAAEHDAVFRAAPDAEVMPVYSAGHEKAGRVNLDAIGDFGNAIVAVQDVNSETGTTQFIKDGSEDSFGGLADRAHSGGGLIVSDCSQSAGPKARLPAADMLVVSAHKFGGPIGIGALLVKEFAMLRADGGHERGYRQGTENMPAALGMAAALECEPSEWHRNDMAADTMYLEDVVKACGGQRVGSGPLGCKILAFSHPTLSAQALLIRLDAMGFAVSAGSACSSGTLKKSRVLDAFGVPDDVAARTIRVSIGWSTTPDELEQFAEAWKTLC